MLTPPLPDTWLAGIVSMPNEVTDEGPAYRPDALLVTAGRFVLGVHVDRPGVLLEYAADAFRATMRSPMVGPPTTPRSVRAWPAALADALRAALPDTVSVTCAPVPELDEVARAMSQLQPEAEAQLETLPPPGISTEAFAELCAAAARLYRARPWAEVPMDTAVITVSCPEVGLQDAVVSVIGKLGENFGFLLFDSYDDFDGYLEYAADRSLPLPAHTVLNYERKKDVPKWVHDELRRLGCEVAGRDATPWLGALGPGLTDRLPGLADYERATAVASALASFVDEVGPLDRWWVRNEKAERTFQTPQGAVTVSIPFGWVEARDGDFDLNESPFDRSGDFDEGAAEEHLEALLERFARSPEAAGLPSPPRYAQLVVDLALRELGVPVAQLVPHHLRDLLFEVIPARVSVDASIAEPMVRELRAFFGFLHRQFGLRSAALCLQRALGPGVDARVRERLADSGAYGVAKSFFMEGAAAGFDVTTDEGLAQWVEAANSASRGQPRAAPASRAPARAKKKKKAAAKARRRSR